MNSCFSGFYAFYYNTRLWKFNRKKINKITRKTSLWKINWNYYEINAIYCVLFIQLRWVFVHVPFSSLCVLSSLWFAHFAAGTPLASDFTPPFEGFIRYLSGRNFPARCVTAQSPSLIAVLPEAKPGFMYIYIFYKISDLMRPPLHFTFYAPSAAVLLLLCVRRVFFFFPLFLLTVLAEPYKKCK